jgi:uncharacterized protein (TIGR02246 family)
MVIDEVEERTRAAETAAIEEVVAVVEHTQNNELVDEFVGLFREDASWTTAHGRRLFGREAITAFTRQVLPGAMRGSAVTFEVEHVLFLRPDVAAVKVRQVYGAAGEGDLGRPMYVMTKEAGRWVLAAGQNTLVVDQG